MATWSDLEKQSPEMAAAGRQLLYQFGPGLGFLATVRRDGGPRVHPICPILCDGRLYALITESPKRSDLLRDGRYALHSFPAVDVDDEFYVTGRATLREGAIAARVREAMIAAGATSTNDESLFELALEHALLSTYKKRGEPDNFPPRYTKWQARTSV